jgi:hypothetical protein
MSLPILTVVGATGTQGGSVVSAFLSEDPPTYQIRALTSNIYSDAAKRLANIPNVTVTHVDINSVDSLTEAFQNSTIIFANTIFSPEVCVEKGPYEAQQLEERQGLNIARAAAKTPSLKHLVWSSLPDTKTITDGEFNIPHFQSKMPAQKFMQDPANGLAQKSSFLYVGMYGNNIERPPYRPIYLVRVNHNQPAGRYLSLTRRQFTGSCAKIHHPNAMLCADTDAIHRRRGTQHWPLRPGNVFSAREDHWPLCFGQRRDADLAGLRRRIHRGVKEERATSQPADHVRRLRSH